MKEYNIRELVQISLNLLTMFALVQILQPRKELLKPWVRYISKLNHEKG